MGGIFSTRRSLIFTEEYRDRVLKTDPIGHWVQDEKGGAASYDMVTQFSGGARNGAYTGVTLGEPGIGDGRTSALFDALNDYNDMHTASWAAAFNGDEGSFGGWCRVSGAGVWVDGVARYLARIRANGTNQIWLSKALAVNTLTCRYQAGGVIETLIHATTTLDWFFLLLTWSASAGGTGEVRLYVDGLQTGAIQVALGVWAGAPVAGTTQVGAFSTAPVGVWDGWLQHPISWGYALSPAQALSVGVL